MRQTRPSSIILSLALGAVLANTACRGTDDAAREPAGRKLIAIITPSHDNPFFKAEAEAAAGRARELGYDVLVSTHDDDAHRQDELVDVAIARRVSAIVLDNAGADASLAAVSKAKAAGVPTFLIDREINRTGVAAGPDRLEQLPGRDTRRRGVRPAGRGAWHLHRARRPGIGHQRRHPQPRVPRRAGQVPRAEDVGRQSANWSQTEAFQKMETLIQANRRHQGRHCRQRHDGARRRRRAPGRRVSRRSSSSASTAARMPSPRSARGDMKATVLQPAADIARRAVDQAHRYITRGRPASRRSRRSTASSSPPPTPASSASSPGPPRSASEHAACHPRRHHRQPRFLPGRAGHRGAPRPARALRASCDITPSSWTRQTTKLGAVETWAHAKACAELFRRHRDRIEGVLVCCPTSATRRAWPMR